MQTLSLDQSVAMISDGARLMIGGFMAVGTADCVIDDRFVTIRWNPDNHMAHRIA